MMNEMQAFTNEQFGEVRVVWKEDEPWFVATDVCKMLDHSNVTMALDCLSKDEKMTLSLTESHSGQRGGAQYINVVNEPGLYRLIFSSRKPEARAVQHWVYHDVLPAIRKTGGYGSARVVPHSEKYFLTAEDLKDFSARLHRAADYIEDPARYALAEDTAPEDVARSNSVQLRYIADQLSICSRNMDFSGDVKLLGAGGEPEEIAREHAFVFRWGLLHYIRVIVHGDKAWFSLEDVIKALGYRRDAETAKFMRTNRDVIASLERRKFNICYRGYNYHVRSDKDVEFIDEDSVYVLHQYAVHGYKKEFDRFLNWEILPKLKRGEFPQ